MTEGDGYKPCPICGGLTDGDWCGSLACETAWYASHCVRCEGALVAEDPAPYCVQCLVEMMRELAAMETES